MGSKIDLILHPVRMQILIALAGRQMTPGDLAATLSDVSQATLYRHIHTLLEGGLLRVVEERQIRGTVEKVYRLADDAGQITDADITGATKADHQRYFLTFLTTLLQDFEHYLATETESVDLQRDGVIYGKAPLAITDDEYSELRRQIQSLIVPYVGREGGDSTRKRYLFTTIVMPETENEHTS